jgi:hypothetical protein
MLDVDLAKLYGVGTGALNQAVKRNQSRFPPDFAFVLISSEVTRLKSQTVISNGRGGRRRSRPRAFTEQGVAMLSSVLRSPRAVAVNIRIMRAFVELRRVVDSDADLALRVAELEKRFDGQFREVFVALRRLMEPPVLPRHRIGFRGPGQ